LQGPKKNKQDKLIMGDFVSPFLLKIVLIFMAGTPAVFGIESHI
jgi:hypothetical protein